VEDQAQRWRRQKRRDIERCLKTKGYLSLLISKQRREKKEKKEKRRYTHEDTKKQTLQMDKSRNNHQRISSMSLENVEQTAPPLFLSDLLDSIIDQPICRIPMTLLSRLRSRSHARPKSSHLRLFMRRILFAEQMQRLPCTVTTLTALSPIMAILDFTQNRAIQS